MSCHLPSIVSPLAAPLQFMVTSFTHLYWYQKHPHPLSVVYKQVLSALPSRYTLNPITSLQIATSTILSSGPLSPSFLDFCNGLLNGLSVSIPLCMLSILPSEIGDSCKTNQMMSLLALHSPVGLLVLLTWTPTSDHDLEGRQPTSPASPPTPHPLTHQAQPHWPPWTHQTPSALGPSFVLLLPSVRQGCLHCFIHLSIYPFAYHLPIYP